MNEPSGASFGISIGLAFVGGYADASSFLLARTFTGHLTGNCVLAAVSAAGSDWYLTLDRSLAVIVFLVGILVSLILNRFVSVRASPLATAMFIEILLFLCACLFISNQANELFIVCMCLGLGIQNGALDRTNGISVHSTYMTGMVTTMMHKSFDYLFQKRNPKEEAPKPSTGCAARVLASMWISFISGAAIGAVMVSFFHSVGLLVILLVLVPLTFAELQLIKPPPYR
jgi:uncharacterized membrane protein YoaK (UPF0700 family)